MRVKEIYDLDQSTTLELPFFTSSVPAGFPSPADDYIDQKLDLNDLVRHPSDTFVVKVEGDSMINAGIHSDDLLLVDRAQEAVNDKVVVAYLNGELTVKRLKILNNKVFLMPENPLFKPIEITPSMSFEIRGVVTFVIHQP
ncbi:MAG: LexA family protein [Thermodesulfobacteriota bacterium]